MKEAIGNYNSQKKKLQNMTREATASEDAKKEWEEATDTNKTKKKKKEEKQ